MPHGMTQSLETLISGLQQASGRDDLQAIVFALRDLYDVDHVVYHAVSSAGQQYAALTYSPEWVSRYLDMDYDRIDPVVQACYSRFHPVDWSRLDWSGRPVKSFLSEAQSAGVGNQGLSVPIRGPNGQFALFTVSATTSERRWTGFAETHMSELILLAHFLNQRAIELDVGEDPQPRQRLSPREIDALTLLAKGYSRSQASDRLVISEHTLRVYIESARLKLGAINTTQAVAKAIASGQIIP